MACRSYDAVFRYPHAPRLDIHDGARDEPQGVHGLPYRGHASLWYDHSSSEEHKKRGPPRPADVANCVRSTPRENSGVDGHTSAARVRTTRR
jgi:hypothetical protein